MIDFHWIFHIVDRVKLRIAENGKKQYFLTSPIVDSPRTSIWPDNWRQWWRTERRTEIILIMMFCHVLTFFQGFLCWMTWWFIVLSQVRSLFSGRDTLFCVVSTCFHRANRLKTTICFRSFPPLKRDAMAKRSGCGRAMVLSFIRFTVFHGLCHSNVDLPGKRAHTMSTHLSPLPSHGWVV